mmetsp:Transcript_7415/g.27718  ORF Transcript_7415/g.27718 Transcript_7415/m.27718 type:complete len:247 (-) Transcript_7415:1681-2421(-)
MVGTTLQKVVRILAECECSTNMSKQACIRHCGVWCVILFQIILWNQKLGAIQLQSKLGWCLLLIILQIVSGHKVHQSWSRFELLQNCLLLWLCENIHLAIQLFVLYNLLETLNFSRSFLSCNYNKLWLLWFGDCRSRFFLGLLNLFNLLNKLEWGQLDAVLLSQMFSSLWVFQCSERNRKCVNLEKVSNDCQWSILWNVLLDWCDKVFVHLLKYLVSLLLGLLGLGLVLERLNSLLCISLNGNRGG